jgi:hypothetical protein
MRDTFTGTYGVKVPVTSRQFISFNLRTLQCPGSSGKWVLLGNVSGGPLLREAQPFLRAGLSQGGPAAGRRRGRATGRRW